MDSSSDNKTFNDRVADQRSRLSTNEKDVEGALPWEKVHLLISEEEKCESHPLFSEIEELVFDGCEAEWRETARWIKFEENVEEGGERWSKPHVTTLVLHSVLELRNLFLNGTVILDKEAQSIEDVVNLLCDNLIIDNILPVESLRKVKEVLLKKHKHLHQRTQSCLALCKPPKAKKTRSTSEDSRTLAKNQSSINRDQNLELLDSHNDILHNLSFMRKVPQEAEASNILVGDVDFLQTPLSAFIRLYTPVTLGNLTEVPVPTRFLFILLTPTALKIEYKEIGRTMATLMSDEVFREVAYRAKNRGHLLAGIDEFLNALIVLPPAEWDPSIRIEPPPFVPSQDQRKSGPQKSVEIIDREDEKQRQRENSGLSRTGVLFGGLINDFKRKAPWYWSDFKDAVSVQCIASWIFLYFACLSPIITFGGLLAEATGRNMAAMESLVAGCVCGVGFGLFSGQPLNILGSTGPVLVFETIVYDFCVALNWDYMSFRFWIGFWIAVILIILVAIDASAWVCYITRFTEENFATLVSLIFVYKAIENVLAISVKYPMANQKYNTDCSCWFNRSESIQGISNETEKHTFCSNWNGTSTNECVVRSFVSDIFLMSIILFLGTFLISVQLKKFRKANFFPTKVRQFISDFAVILAILIMTVIDFKFGIATPKLEVPNEFKPTLSSRGWLIPPFTNNPLYSIFLAIPPALLGTILIFMDQQITCVIVNRREHKLKKGCGYHLDLFIVSLLILFCSIMGLPWFVAATVLSVNHVNSLKLESECAAPGDKPQFLGVREQRVTHVLIALSIGFSVFLTPMLGYIPMPVLFGVFLYMGVSSLKGLQFFDRILIMFMPKKYQPDFEFLRQVPVTRVHLYTVIQIGCMACLWIIKSFSQTSILFPLMLVVMVGIRKILEYFFTERELNILDDILPRNRQRNSARKSGCFNKISTLLLGPKLEIDNYDKCTENSKDP